MKWVWIRHGETDANRQGRYLGHIDAPLNAEGRRQAARWREAARQATTIYSSDLTRCAQTARALAGNQPIRYTSALRELNFGAWDGMRYDDIEKAEPKRLSAWLDDPWSIAPPGGETLTELGNRVDAWLAAAMERHALEDEIWVVAHGGPLRWLLCRWLYEDPKKFWEAPGAPHGGGVIIEWDGRRWGQLRLLN